MPSRFNIIKKRYYFYVFGFPLIYALLPFSTKSYGKNENTLSCWILINDEVKDASDAWQLIFFGFVFLAICFTSYVYFSVFYKFTDLRVSLIFIALVAALFIHSMPSFSQDRGSETSNKIVDAIDRVKWYPIILVVVYIVPFLIRCVKI